jgi:flagellar basal body-associated protein FliL
MKYLLIAIVIIIVVGIIVIGTQVYGYSSLKTDFSATDVSPKFKINTKSIVTGLLSVFQRNLLGAVSSFIQGLQVNGTVFCK